MDSFEPHFHQIHIKPHADSLRAAKRDSLRPPDRTLFVLNVPPYITETNLQNAFEDAGQVERIYLCDKPGEFADDVEESEYFRLNRKFSFKCAYLVFRTSKGMQNAMQLSRIASGPIKCGMQKWCDQNLARIPDPVRLQAEIDTFISQYDEKKQIEDEAAKNNEADDDGWVTVTKKTHPVIEKKESIFNRIEEKEQQKKNRKELKDFYRFQSKDSKVQQIAQLRKRFEEDKKKVEQLKKSRRFKPF